LGHCQPIATDARPGVSEGGQAFIRTGLALVALGTGLLRGFGLGPWTVFDIGIIVVGTVMTVFGARGYFVTRKIERIFTGRLKDFLTATADLSPARRQ
jgi:hypothetical protein